jgi:mRNA-degrading endonuclease RelE of RelBE toxin-antitoxin system
MNRSEDMQDMLENTVNECQVKMELINDYLGRFKISDTRILAPIHDIERCVSVLSHILHRHDEGDHCGAPSEKPGGDWK